MAAAVATQAGGVDSSAGADGFEWLDQEAEVRAAPARHAAFQRGMFQRAPSLCIAHAIAERCMRFAAAPARRICCAGFVRRQTIWQPCRSCERAASRSPATLNFFRLQSRDRLCARAGPLARFARAAAILSLTAFLLPVWALDALAARALAYLEGRRTGFRGCCGGAGSAAPLRRASERWLRSSGGRPLQVMQIS